MTHLAHRGRDQRGRQGEHPVREEELAGGAEEMKWRDAERPMQSRRSA